jgi:Putative peptidoglycan binding domain
MKAKQIISLLVGITFLALGPVTWARGGGGGGGGFGGGGGRGGAGFGRPAFGGRPAYYYSRGMGYANSRVGQVRSPARPAPSGTRAVTRGNNSGARQGATSGRPTLNGRTDHIAERHNANWHGDWDRRHAHFFNHRFFIFDDGFWFGLDDGFYPWDYYPYYSYDYYPYDYYPGYYADVEPYYYNEGGYSDEPMVDQTVTTVQTELTQLGFYNGPIDGIFGPTTRDAVANYQVAKQLNVTGSLSPDTLQSLGLPQAPAS